MGVLKTRLILRNDSSANWESAETQNLLLLKGEAGVEWYSGTGDLDGDQVQDSGETPATPRMKIGDGFTKWSDLPYLQSNFISTSVGISGSGNTVVGASVIYDEDSGIYSLSLTKANRVVDIKVSDDNVVNLEVTKDWNSGHTVTASHAEQGPASSDTTSSANSGNATPTADKTISIPKITVNKYGHTTAIANETVTIKAHDIAVTNDGNTTGNTVISIAKDGNHEIKYKLGNRLTGSNLTADTILLGGGGVAVKTSGKKIETTLTNDDTKVPTSGAVYAEIQDVLSIANAAMTLVGTLGSSSSGATHTSLSTASKDQLGDAYKVVTAGTYGGITAKVGDLIVCYSPTSTTYAWILIPSGDDIEDSWRPVQLDGAQKLASGITSGALNIKNISGNSVSIGYNSGFTFDVKTGFTNEGRNYGVKKDSSGNLYVEVPWTDNNTTYSASKGITIIDGDIQHTNSVTAGTASGTNSTTAQALGATISIPSITYDAQGHITGKGTTSFVLPNATSIQGAVKGYGQITVGSTTISAVGHNEKFTMQGDTWITLAATDSSTAGSDKITFTHKEGKKFTGGTATKTLSWSNTSFVVPKITTDDAGHLTAASDITFNIPSTEVTTSLKGLAPKAVANSFLVTKNAATAASWEQFVIIDGGSAGTTDWGIIS